MEKGCLRPRRTRDLRCEKAHGEEVVTQDQCDEPQKDDIFSSGV